MNARHRTLVAVLRTLFGAFMLMSGVTGFMAGFSGFEGIPADMLETTKMLWSTGIFQMIKMTEIVAGLMLVLNLFPSLAAIFLAPIAVGIVVVNSQTAPSYVITGIIVCAFEAYLGYVYWNDYKPLFTRKRATS